MKDKMLIILKKFIFISTINFCFFLCLMIGTQNGSNKTKVNLLVGETIELPIGFTLGISFITGSILGGIASLKLPENDHS